MTLMPRIIVLGLILLGALPAAHAGPGRAISVTDGWTRVTNKDHGTARGFLTVRNRGDAADALVSVACPVALETTIRDDRNHVLPDLRLRPGQTLRLTPSGPHLVLEHTHFQFYPHALIPCSVAFRHAGTMMVYLHVEPAGAKSYHTAGISRSDRN